MRSILTKLLLSAAALIMFGLPSAHAQTKISPANQIRWPNCGPGQPYVPDGNTCFSISEQITAPVAGQHIVLNATTNSGGGAYGDLGWGANDIGGGIFSTQCASLCGYGSFFGPSWSGFDVALTNAGITTSQVTSVYAFAITAQPMGGVIPGAGLCAGGYGPNRVGATISASGGGGANLDPSNTSPWPMQQVTALLTSATGSNLNTISIGAYANGGSDCYGQAQFMIPEVGLIVYYTGTAVAGSTFGITVDPPLGWDSTTDSLYIDPGAVFPSDILLASTIGNLPPASATPGAYIPITDGASASDCTVGGGTYKNLCTSNGTTWVVYSPPNSVVQSLSATSQTTSWSPTAYTTIAAGLYRFSYFISPLSGTGSPTTDLHVTFTDDHASGNYQNYSDTWTSFPTWDWDDGIIYATSGSTITPTVTVTGTINYNVRYKLEYLGP